MESFFERLFKEVSFFKQDPCPSIHYAENFQGNLLLKCGKFGRVFIPGGVKILIGDGSISINEKNNERGSALKTTTTKIWNT